MTDGLDELIDNLEFEENNENNNENEFFQEKQIDLYSYIEDIFQKITHSVDVEATLNIIVDVIKEYIAYDSCVIVNSNHEPLVERGSDLKVGDYIKKLYDEKILGWVKDEQKQTVYKLDGFTFIVVPLFIEAQFEGFFILMFSKIELTPGILNMVSISSYLLATFTAKMKLYNQLVEKTDNLEIEMNETRNLYKELQLIYDFTKKMGSVFDKKTLFSIALKTIKEAFNAHKATILVFDRENHSLQIECSKPEYKIGKKLPVCDFFKKIDQNPEIINQKDNIDLFVKNNFKYNSLFSAPVFFKEKLYALIMLSERETNKPYSERDEKILQSFAQQTTNSLENIRLYNQFIEKQKIERDIELARNIQVSLLPSRPPVLNQLDVAAISMPARQVGGDYYDFYKISDDECWFLLGDVSGKGIAAALLMAMIRSLFRSELRNANENTGELLTEINRLIATDIYEGKFITFVCAFANMKNNKMYFTSAGHVPFVHYQADKKEIVHYEADGLPVGIMEDVKYSTRCLKMKEEDFIIFFTDGVNEAMNKNREEFGSERLEAVIKKNTDKSSNGIIKSILLSIEDFTQKQPQHDDTTILVIKKINKKFNSTQEKLVVESTIEDVNRFVEKLVKKMESYKIFEDDIFDIRLALSELMINAAKHGNQFKSDKKIYVKYFLSREKIEIEIEDEGTGFDYSFLKDYESRLLEENGRGIILVSSIADKFIYNKQGNKVELIRYFKGLEV
ncbi:MAG: SpoIIE family protein phosphatase [Candidatus Muiribacteriota bacterium]